MLLARYGMESGLVRTFVLVVKSQIQHTTVPPVYCQCALNSRHGASIAALLCCRLFTRKHPGQLRLAAYVLFHCLDRGCKLAAVQQDHMTSRPHARLLKCATGV